MSVKISGDLRLAVERGRLFRAIHDVDILRVTVPGCEALEQTAADTYTGTAKVGIAVIKGTYHGTVKLLEERGEEYIRVAVEAKSGHAEIRGEGGLTLTADGVNTQVRGPLAAVGQRLLPSASKSLTEQFFRNIEKKLQQENAS